MATGLPLEDAAAARTVAVATYVAPATVEATVGLAPPCSSEIENCVPLARPARATYAPSGAPDSAVRASVPWKLPQPDVEPSNGGLRPRFAPGGCAGATVTV